MTPSWLEAFAFPRGDKAHLSAYPPVDSQTLWRKAVHMAKPARVETKPTPPPPVQPALTLVQPLFGVTKGSEAGKWVAVRYENGATEVLTPKRGGKDVGEALHFATARVVDAFKASVLRGKLHVQPKPREEAVP